jgi:restriction system protein
MTKPTWMVRAAGGGVLLDEFRERSVVAIGWSRLGNLTDFKNKKAIEAKINAIWPDWSRGKLAISAGMVHRFVDEVKVGDGAITYDSSRRLYLVGEITGDYEYVPQELEEYPNIHRVKWLGEVSRDALSVASKNSLGAISTLFMLSDDAAAEVQRVLAGDPKAQSTTEEELESNEDELLKDIQARAIEFIKDKVNRLDWEEMQELVAGVLRAMGYKTKISPNGPDRGKDIVASPDGFGFESPRIIVEVKHRTASMGSQEIRSFLGGRHKDDKGLYVSTGGFSKDAKYEAERASIPLTLMDIDDLVQAIVENYEKMDIDTQRLLPLKKLFWPA